MSLFSLALAWLRARRVAMVAMTISALGVMAMITVVALMDGVQRFIADHLRVRDADIVARHRSFGDDRGHFGAALVDLAPELSAAGGPLRAMAPRFEEIGLIWRLGGEASDEEIQGVRLLGVDLALERQVTDFDRRTQAVQDGALRLREPLADDALIRLHDGYPGILLGDRLAQRLRVAATRGGGPGDLVRVSVARFDVDTRGIADPSAMDQEALGRYVATRTFRVIGAADTNREEFDALHGWVDLGILRSMIFERPERGVDAQAVLLGLSDPSQADEVARRLSERHPAWRFSTAASMAPAELGAIQDQKRLFIVILSFITLAGSAGIGGMVFTMVREKTRDIGILRSMGLSRRRMVLAFTLYGSLLGVIGAFVGTGLGLALTDRLDAVIGFASDLFGVQLLNPEVYPFERVPTYLDPSAIATILAANIGTTFLASLLPALRAGLLRPVRALRAD